MTETTKVEEIPKEFAKAIEQIHRLVPADLAHPQWGIICGSGLSTLGEHLEEQVVVEYDSLEGFPNSTVQGHRSAFVFGKIRKDGAAKDSFIPVTAALGRFHLYEGHPAQICILPIRLFRCLGVKAVVITNAAGGLNSEFQVGTIMAMSDHIGFPSMTSLNPLIGPNFSLGTRFPSMSDAYDPILQLALFKAAKDLQLDSLVTSGTYIHVIGPTYESRAESRLLGQFGDAVGMSTVPEVIASRQCSMRVLAISLITNKVVIKESFNAKQAADAGMTFESARQVLEKESKGAANHEEVLQVGQMRANDIRKLVEHVICHTPLSV